MRNCHRYGARAYDIIRLRDRAQMARSAKNTRTRTGFHNATVSRERLLDGRSQLAAATSAPLAVRNNNVATGKHPPRIATMRSTDLTFA
ncbi:unnamed protein product [Arctia plantaginis]|uniref:Uncharacterized protein n=1 Tax=Arctia plantaginis TaxID=874455 RepID=A0A8S1B4V3_ARCPL|nr:unnamed protein product [Arctia plantaginis]